MYLRKGTFDGAIWYSVRRDYPATPERFSPGEVVLDVGCHIGTFCDLVAKRGATVVGYEADPRNYGLACINLAAHPRVSIRHAAVWRSDGPTGKVAYLSSPEPGNTGSGSVLFQSPRDIHDLHAARGAFTPADASDPDSVSGYMVPAVGLDSVLEELGEVRLMKLDVEGSEYPILLTATRLRQVELIVGEYHEFTDAEMEKLSPAAGIGGGPRYSRELLRSTLADQGFEVELRPTAEQFGLFTARRR